MKTPVSRNAKHILTEDEIRQNNEALLAALQAKKEIEAEKKEVASSYKNKIAEQELAIDKISNLMRVGYEIRPFQCYLVKNFETGKREYYEFGSDKLIDSEPLNAADYQLDIEQTEAKIAENNEKEQLQEVIEDKVEEAGAELDFFGDEPSEELPVEDEISPSDEELSFYDVVAPKEENKASEPSLSVVKDESDFDFGDDEDGDDSSFPFDI